MSEEQKLSRRNFLSLATLAIGGFISSALVIPAVVYILGPALQSQKTQEWILLGSTKKIGLGTPTLFKANIQKQTGWIQTDQEISAYCLTEDGRNYIAYRIYVRILVAMYAGLPISKVFIVLVTTEYLIKKVKLYQVHHHDH